MSTILPALPQGFEISSFWKATAVTPHETDKNRYLLDVKRDWCIGLVPNGGYLMACLANAAKQHFSTHLSSLNQLDMITSNYEFLGRSVIGPAEILITVLKIGRQFSTVRVQLLQGTGRDGKPGIAIEAILTQGNLVKESQNGLLNLQTRTLLSEESLKREDSVISFDPFADWRPGAHKIEMYVGKDADEFNARPCSGPSVREQWVCFSNAAGEGKSFDNTTLAYLADAFRPVPEQYGLSGNWYPTLNARVEVKEKEPEHGWKWLYMRIEMKLVQHGRFDYEVIICNEDLKLVAVSHHTGLIVSAERNLKVKGSGAKI